MSSYVRPHGLRFRLLLMVLATVGPFSLNIFKPCLPFIRATFDATVPEVQLGLSLAVFGSAVASLMAGPWADAGGRGPVLRWSLGAYAVGSLLSMAAPSVAVMVVGRVLQAAASSVGLVLCRAIATDIYGQSSLAKAITWLSVAGMAGVLFAPVLGGLIIETAGWRAVFGFSALAGFGALALAHGRVAERVEASHDEAQPLRAVASLLRSPAFFGYLLHLSLQFALMLVFTSVAAWLMVEQLGRPAWEYGVWFVVLGAVAGGSCLLGLWLDKRLPSRVVVLLGGLLMGTAGLVPWLGFWDSLTPARLFLPGVVACIGTGMSFPIAQAAALRLRKELAGTISGAMSFCQLVAAGVFTQLVVVDAANMLDTLALIVGVLTGGALLGALLCFLPDPLQRSGDAAVEVGA